MTDQDSTSTRPYLIRALHEWCSDNGFAPYLAVRVDGSVQVPMEYVNDGEIVLNLSLEATSGLRLGNDFIEFTARFGGKPREIMVPVGRVTAIYARENGQGMAFPPPVDLLPDDVQVPMLSSVPASAPKNAVQGSGDGATAEQVVQLVPSKPRKKGSGSTLPDSSGSSTDGSVPPPRPPAGKGKKPALKRVK